MKNSLLILFFKYTLESTRKLVFIPGIIEKSFYIVNTFFGTTILNFVT